MRAARAGPGGRAAAVGGGPACKALPPEGGAPFAAVRTAPLACHRILPRHAPSTQIQSCVANTLTGFVVGLASRMVVAGAADAEDEGRRIWHDSDFFGAGIAISSFQF